MALIDEIRRKNPSLNDRSDDEIKSILRQSPEFQYFNDEEFDAYVSGEPQRERPEETPGFWGGVSAGIDQVQGMGGGLLMAAGEAMESEGVLGAGRDIYQRNMDEAAENDLGYGFTDIRSVGDAWNWARYTAGNQLPMLAASMAGGGVGGVAARTLAGAAAKRAATQAGQALGAMAASTGMETGAIMGETEDLDVSLAHGALAGSLDAITPVRLLRRTGAHELADKAADEISEGVLRDLRRQAGMTTRRTVTRDGARTVAEEAGDSAWKSARRGSLTNMLGEMGTEGLQGLISQHANYWVENNGESLLANLDDVDVSAIIDEAAAGGLMGGLAGAPAGLAERGQARTQVARIEAAREQAARQGGDPLDQTLAGQQAEQGAKAEDPGPQGPTPEQTGSLYQRLQRGLAVADELETRDRDLGGVTRQRMKSATRKLDGADKAFERGDYREAESLLAQAEAGFTQINDDLGWMAREEGVEQRRHTASAPQEGERQAQAPQPPTGLLGGAMGEARATGPTELGQPTDTGLPGFGPNDLPRPTVTGQQEEGQSGPDPRESAMEAGRQAFKNGGQDVSAQRPTEAMMARIRPLPQEDQDAFLAGWKEAKQQSFDDEIRERQRAREERRQDAVREFEGDTGVIVSPDGVPDAGTPLASDQRTGGLGGSDINRYARIVGREDLIDQPDSPRLAGVKQTKQNLIDEGFLSPSGRIDQDVLTRLPDEARQQLFDTFDEMRRRVGERIGEGVNPYMARLSTSDAGVLRVLDTWRGDAGAQAEQASNAPVVPSDFPEGFEPYQSTIRGRGEMWTVPMERGKRQGGDTLHDTLDEALEQAQRNVRQEARDARNQQEIAAQAQQEGDREAARQAEINEIGELLGLPTFRAGRARDTLMQRANFNGRPMTRKARIDEVVEQGAVIEGEGKDRRMVFGDDRFLDQKALTKTGMDYAAALIARRGEGTATAETETALAEGDEVGVRFTAPDRVEQAFVTGRPYTDADGTERVQVAPRSGGSVNVPVSRITSASEVTEAAETQQTDAPAGPRVMVNEVGADGLTEAERRQKQGSVTPEERAASDVEERYRDRLDRIRRIAKDKSRSSAEDVEAINAIVQEQMADPDTYDKLNTDLQMLERAAAGAVRQRMQAAEAKPRGEVTPQPVADRPARPAADVVRPEGRPRWRTKKAAEGYLEEVDALGLYTAEAEGKGWILRREPKRTFEIQTRTRQSTAGADQAYTVNETVLLRPEGMDANLFEQVVKAQARAPVQFVQHKKRRVARLATRDAEKVVRHLEGDLRDRRDPEEINDKPLTLFPAEPAGTVVDSIESPEAKAKAQRARREERDDGSDDANARRRTEELLGAGVGDVVTFSRSIGYAGAGRDFRIKAIDRSGNALVEGVASGGRIPVNTVDLERAVADGVTITRAGQQAEPAPQADGWGDNNTLVSKDRAEEIRQKLKARLGTLNSGFDPEMLALGAELAAFHMEAGARKFGAFARAMASDLGTSVSELRPYLRGWYNGGRDMMEDNGLDVADMDGPEQVREAMKDLAALEAEPEAQAETPPAEEAADGALSEGEAESLAQRLVARGLSAHKPDQPGNQGRLTPQRFDRSTGEFIFDVYGVANAGVPLTGRDMQALERGERLAKRTEGTSEFDVVVGLNEAAAERNLASTLYRRVDEITDNRKLKAVLAEHHGIRPSEVTDGLLKEGQEAMEFALVRRARDLVAEGGSDRAVFDRLTAMYRNQPNLDVRSSSSMARQAYSTPAPMAYLTSRLAGIGPGVSVYEPTAGNGMLLIGADIDQAIVNELDDRRAGHLQAQGFAVTQHDATDWIPKQGARSAIMNPPFGKLRHPDGSLAPVKVDGYTIKAIDHLIAAKALSAIPDDGRATLIIGANKKAGEIGAADRTFFNWLYSHYNVVGHFEADGDLYSRQGAGWPVRIITVNGRVRSDKISPKSGVIERAETWEQVYEQYERSLAASQQPIPDSTGADGGSQSVTADAVGGAARGDGQQGRPTGARGRGRRGESQGDTRAGSRPGTGDPRGDQPSGVRTERAGSGQSVQRDVAQPADRGTDAGAGSARGAGSANAGQLGRRSEGSAESAVSGSQYQTAYQARSAGFNDAVLIPNSMAQPTQEALTALENAVGNLDQYVQNKLGYDSREAMHKAFMGLQVDAVAASIYNIENDKGIIIADQTGVGKGRQAAAVIRYARLAGKTPVFMTVKDNLFSDMYGDLRDIGDHDVKPFVVNQGSAITWQGQEVQKSAASGKHRRLLREIANTGQLPDGHDALFLTYSQIRTDNLQRQVLEALGENAVFVLDEAHEVSGEREKKIKGGATKKTGAGFIYDLIDGKPVVYLSATYAKRPDNMPVYYRTDVSDAVDNVDQLVEAVQNGGVPLQTVVSNMLAASGQLFRRERSYEGISIETVIDTENTSTHESVSDQVTEGLRAIIAADRRFHSFDMEGLKDAAEDAGGSATTAGNQASKSLDHQNFTSVLHNYIGQLLMGLKADKAADMAIDMHRRGIKPVMALENTMGSFLNEFAMENGLEDGDPVDATYRDVLSRALERTRRYSVTAANGDREPVQVSLGSLEPSTRALYDEAQAVIDSLDLGDIPISPIDHMRKRLTDAGIRVAELTGRDRMIDYSGAEPVLTRRDAEERKNARGTVDAFNSGALDAIILNRSGSTGLSIHASERFEDQRERHMIVLQAPGDINILMQMLGRVNRTGQVVKPGYSMMGLNIPAEKRPLAVTAKKMKSLNANTSANTESDTSVNAADILNKYGDQVVNEYLANNRALAETLDIAPSTNQAGELSAPPEGLAMKFTGRLATLEVAEQRAVYEDVERAYTELIDYLNKTGQNDLEPQTLDLDARIQDSKVIYQGKAPETIFGGHTYLHQVDAKYQGTPPNADEVKAALEKATKQGSPEAQAREILATLEGDEATLEAAIRADEQKAAEIQREATQLRDQHGIRSGSTEEVVAALKERGEDKAARQIEKALENYQKIQQRTEAAREVWASTRRQTQEALSDTFLIGNRVRLDLKEETVTGVVTDVKSSHRQGKGNPWALSKTRVKFMVNSGIRTIELPLSRLQPGEGMLLEQLQSRGTEGLGAIFKGDTGNMRETRYVATGNLIAAAAGKDKGRITSFTDGEGKTHLGLLMPKKYDGKQFEAAGTDQNIPLRQLDVAARFMREQREALEKLGGVFSEGQVARLTPVGSDRWEISVPKANKEPIARAVKFNQPLIDAMGEEFHGKGQRMVAQFDDGRLERVLPAMSNVAPLHALPSFRPEWERAGGEPAPEAIQAFDPDSVKDDGTPRYSLLSRGEPTGTSQVAVQMAVNDYPELGDVQVVRDPSELPDSVLTDMLNNGIAPDLARGVYVQGRTYVIASNVASPQEGVRAAIHEAVGHQGIHGLLGSELDTTMLALYRSLPNSPEGRAVLKEVRQNYPFLDERKREDRIIIGEEAVAHLLEKGHRPKAWQRLVAKIREVLRRAFPSLDWSYTEVLALGERSRDWLRQAQEQRKRQAEPGSDAFKLWFGKSKAVDSRGKPKVYYHGTNADFGEFKPSPQTHGLLFFTADQAVASEYASGDRSGYTGMYSAEDRIDVRLMAESHPAMFDGLHLRTGLDPQALGRALQFGSNIHTIERIGERVEAGEITADQAARQYNKVVDQLHSGGNVMPVYLSAQNPINSPRKPMTWRQAESLGAANIRLRGGDSVWVTEGDGVALAVIDPRQIKSAIGNRGTFDAANPDIRYSLGAGRPQSVASHYDDLDADQQAFVGKFGSQTPKQKAMQWWKEKTDRLGLRLRQGLVDAQAALLELDKQALGSEEALTSQITKSSWVLGRMAHAANGAVHAMLNNGRIYLDPQERVIDLKDDDSKGLGSVLGQLGEAPEIERFMMWIAANRSQKLAAQGRENLFTEEEIAAGVRLNSGTLADGRDRARAYEQTFAEFQQYRDDVLAIAEQSGLLKPAMTDYQALRTIAKQYKVPRALRDELRQAKRDINRADDPEVREMADERFDAAAYAVMQAAAQQEGSMDPVERLKDQLMTSQRELWAEEFYVPFYRLAEDKDKTQPGMLATNGLSRQQAYKRLKGGTSNINDLMQNTMMNFHHLIEASLKNQAAAQAMDNAESLGIARAVSSTEAAGSKTSTFVLRDGQQVWYEIDDPMVYAAVTAMAHPGMNSTLMTVMRRFKRLFTNMTTTTPQFMIANLIRDTLQATATNDVSKNVIKNVMQGYGTYKDEQTRARMLASGASFNFGHLYQGNPDELRDELTRTLRGADIIRDPRDLKKVLKLWDRWNDMNNFAENINRAAIYQQNMDAGRGKLYSAFESRDLIDFSARGAWPATRILIDVVPFLNARIQGLDKIYRSGVKPGTNVVMAAFGKGQAGVTDKQAAARFFTVAGALAMASIALMLHNQDDEEYQKLEDWHKDTYWWFRLGDAAISIPKPFEVGAIATLAERITQQFVDDRATGELFRERLQHMVSDTFSFTVVPQMLQPAMNIYANKDDFTNRPIETMGMERLSPELRKRSSTTGIATATSRLLNATVGAIGDPDLNPLALSPVQIDHLIQGYFGQVGSFAAGTADVGWRSMKGEESPAKHWYERQPVRRFYQNLGLEDRYTKHGTVFYDGLREAQRAYSDVKELRELGELERAASLVEDKRGMLAMRKRLNRAQRRLSSINQRMELVRMSDVSGEVKRQRLDRLRAIKNRIQRLMSERLQDINA